MKKQKKKTNIGLSVICLMLGINLMLMGVYVIYRPILAYGFMFFGLMMIILSALFIKEYYLGS